MQHGVRHKEEKSRVHDWVPLLGGLILGVFKFVYVCRVSLHVLRVHLHLSLEIQNVRAMEAHTHGLEVLQEVSRLDGRVEKIRVA